MNAHKLKARLLPALMVTLAAYGALFAQTDDEKFQVALVAMDTYHDCVTAREVLLEMSEARQKNALWIFQMARSYQCTENLADLLGAIKWYEEYDRQVPKAVVDRLIDLRAKAGAKANEAARKNKEISDRVGDVSGLWELDGSYRNIFRITQNANQVTIVYDTVYDLDYEDYGWRRGDVKFEGIRTGNRIAGKYNVRLANYHDASKCADKPLNGVVDVVFEISDDGNRLEMLYGSYSVKVDRDYNADPIYVCKPEIEMYSKSATWNRKQP